MCGNSWYVSFQSPQDTTVKMFQLPPHLFENNPCCCGAKGGAACTCQRCSGGGAAPHALCTSTTEVDAPHLETDAGAAHVIREHKYTCHMQDNMHAGGFRVIRQ